jgi:hypothetical protein
MKVAKKISGCLLAVLSFVGAAIAQNNVLPNLPMNTPSVAFSHSTLGNPYGIVSYNPGTQVFSMTGTAISVNFPPLSGVCETKACPTGEVSFAIQVDNNGNLISGTQGQSNFAINGQVTNASTSTTYSSPLLTGQVTQFFYDGVNYSSNFYLRIAVTGGSMASLYVNPGSLDNDLLMTLSLENQTGYNLFSRSEFAVPFGGVSKGNVYSTPPVSAGCTGEIGDFVWNDLNGNGIQDPGEPGIDGVTVNLYNSGVLIASQVTAQGPTGSQQGYYEFAGVCAGIYTVQVDTTTLPKGQSGQTEYVLTTPNAPGSTPTNDSNPNPDTVTLTSNVDVDNMADFGFVALQGEIAGDLWFDANYDGLQDTGDPSINGVGIELYDGTQTNLLATTTTAFGGPNNENGYYQFTGLGAGNYVVYVIPTTLPPNYSPTTPDVGNNPAINSNNSPVPVSLPTDSSTDLTVDFGYVSPCNGTIGHFIWHDLNDDGLQDPGDPGISGVTVYLYDSNDNLIQTAITNGSGDYQFSGLCDDSYTVVVNGTTLPPNFTPATPHAPGSTPSNDSIGSPAPVTLTLDSNNNVISNQNINFGYVSPCNGVIGYFVWNDLNGNGIQDPGEPGIPNVTVSLFDSEQHLLNATTTNPNGDFQFTGLCAGTYIVQVTPPAGFSPTIVNAPGGTPANDSNPNPDTAVLTITDSNGDVTNDEDVNFGFVLTNPVGASCILIDAEQGIAIAPTQLVGSGGLGGPYTFMATGLPPGLSISSSGLITGTPTATGTYPYTVTITDGAGNTGNLNCTITVAPPLSVACAAVTTGEVNVAFNSGPMTVSGGTAPYTYSVVGTLPAGLSLNTSTGAISGTPTAAGTFTVKVTDANGAASSGCAITINAALTATCAAVTTGEVNVAFNSGPMTVSGGTAPYTYSVVGTLPAGLSLNTSTGAISGTPTAAGTFTVKVTDANGAASSGCAITINAALSATCAAVTTGEVNVAFNSGPMTVSGGTAPYTYSVVGTLPAGLSLNTSTGAISGTPTAAGTFTVKVTDANGAASSGCAITIVAGPSVSCSTVTSGQVGISFSSGSITVSGGKAPYTYSVVGTLPAGLSLNTSTGAITGTPTASGTFSIQVRDANGVAGNVTCPITIAPAVSATCVLISAVQGVAITPLTLAGSGGSGGPYTFTATGLPSGLTMSSNGTITGTPTVTGTFNYTVTITDAAGHTGTLKCSVTVVPPVTANCGCSSVTQGQAMTPVTLTASGGSGGPYTFTASGLPAGLTISPSGTISGTATVSGTFNYTVTITDNTGHSGTIKCTITAKPAPPVTSTCICGTAQQGIAITAVTMVGSGGVGGPYTFTATGLPNGLTISSSGTISGTPTVSGTFSYTVTVTDSAGNKGTVNCTVTVNASPVSATCLNISAVQGKAITPSTMVGSGGAGGPYTFSATGLPAGLTMSSNGTISGTPTVNGTFNYTVTITDSKGNRGTLNCSIKVCPPVTGTAGCANGQRGHQITPIQVQGSGGSGGPYTFSGTGLPPGLSISSSGVISGTPTQSGSYNYAVTVYDSAGHSGTVNCMSNIN